MMWFLVLKYCSGYAGSRWIREQVQGEAEAGQEVIVVVLRRGNEIFICGNGTSMGDTDIFGIYFRGYQNN